MWAVDLRVDDAVLEAVAAPLSPDERERANRFVFDRDRRRFIVARAALRGVLGAYLDATPSSLTFEYGAHGKPALGGTHAGAIAFNVSHSGEMALIAVASSGEIGVDVEAERTMSDLEDIAQRFFAPSEVSRLCALPASRRHDAFFRCWTRKEAYLKALGDGLARPLDGFEVTFDDASSSALRVLDDAGESERWAVTPLPAPAGYAAALVTPSPAPRVTCLSWIGGAETIGSDGIAQLKERV